MMKKVLACVMLSVSCLCADVLDDIALLVSDNKLDHVQAVVIAQSYAATSKAHVVRLKKKLEAHDEDGFWATIRGNTYQIQWAAAKMSLMYHKKVLAFIESLPKNERDRENLISHLTLLQQHMRDLFSLRTRYKKAESLMDKLKLRSLIAAKDLQIKGRKTLIKSNVLLVS